MNTITLSFGSYFVGFWPALFSWFFSRFFRDFFATFFLHKLFFALRNYLTRKRKFFFVKFFFREIEIFFWSDIILIRECVLRIQSFVKVGQVVSEKSVPNKHRTHKRFLLLGWLCSLCLLNEVENRMSGATHMW